jgi:hypothetical protein
LSDKRNNYAYGDLNPAFSSDVKKRFPFATNVKASTLLKPALENVFKSDALKAVGRFKAIVLRVEDSTVDEPGSWLATSDDIEPGGDGLLRIRARIPELHPYPVPTGEDDHQAINLYPIFKAKDDSLVAKPAVGSLIWVDFGNREAQTDPIYLGPVIGSRASAEGTGNISPKGKVNERQAGSIDNPNKGDQITAPTKEVEVPPSVSSTGGTSYSKNLNDIDFNKVPQKLIDYWSPRLSTKKSRAFKLFPIPSNRNELTQNQKWTIIIMGCCQVMLEYWRQQHKKAIVIITSHFRSMTTKNHNGGAIDFKVRAGGKTLTALQAWAGMRRLIRAGRIPDGGKGLYLNVTEKGSRAGVKGILPEQAGKTSVSNGPPGSSGSPHYDFRGSYGYQLRRRPNPWISLDLTGEGKDDIPGAYVGSERKKAIKYLNGLKVRIIPEDSKLNDKDGVNITKSIQGRYVQLENPLKDVAKFYQGGWKTYEHVPTVGSDVPNLLNVLGQEVKEGQPLV